MRLKGGWLPEIRSLVCFSWTELINGIATFCMNCLARDRGDHFKVVELKNLANAKKR